MAEANYDEHPIEEGVQPTGEDLADRLFALVMTGVLAVILAMTIMGDF